MWLLLPLLPFLLAFHPTVASSTNETGFGYGIKSDFKPAKESAQSESLEYEVEDVHGNLLTDDSHESNLSKRWGNQPKGNTIRQTSPDPPEELKFMSQKKGSRIDNVNDFAYADYAGSGATIYIHDTGLNLDHSEFQAKRPQGVKNPKVERLIPKKTLNGQDLPQDVDDTDGHGTCTASKAIGQLTGVAKSASLKLVPWGNSQDPDHMLTGLEAIVKDIERKKKKKGKKGFLPVVNLSYTWGPVVMKGDRLYNEGRKRLLEMIKLGALPVTTAGNVGNIPVGYYPAKFMAEAEFKDSMIVVGGFDVEGKRWKHSQTGPLVEVWAPATVSDTEGAECAATNGAHDFHRKIGTSLSAPAVSGLAAYLHSTFSQLEGDDAAKKTKETIMQYSHQRGRGPADDWPKSVWNVVQGNVCP